MKTKHPHIPTQDYSPFGVTLIGRSWSGAEYRYGFNGQEIEEGITGTKSHTSAEFWMYDARLGRRWEIDPLFDVFCFLSPYATLGLNPIALNDVYGLSAGDPIKIQVEGAKTPETNDAQQGSLPSSADDQQQIIFEFTEGQIKSITYTFQSGKGWTSSRTYAGEGGEDIQVGGGRYYPGNPDVSMEEISSRYAVNFESSNAVVESHAEANVRSKHGVSKKKTQPQNTKNTSIAKQERIQQKIGTVTSTAGLGANMVEIAAREAQNPKSYRYGVPTNGEMKGLNKVLNFAKKTANILGLLGVVNDVYDAGSKFKEGNYKGALWSGFKGLVGLGFACVKRATPITFLASAAWAIFSSD